MTNDDKLRRLREWLRTETFPTVRRDTDAILEMVESKIDRLLAEPEAQAPSEAAPPVTDAEVEAAIVALTVAARREAGATQEPSRAAAEARANRQVQLKALIARRVQQAGAAAEELARAVEAFFDHSVSASIWIDEMGTALAAFRAAQGGAS